MSKDYFVLYKRDKDGESHSKCAAGRLMYDKIKEFRCKEDAIEFGLSNLQDTPVLAKTVRAARDCDPRATYVAAAFFQGKYQHHSFDGSSDPIPTHEVVKCGLNTLDSVVQTLANEGPGKLYLGVEEKMLPDFLDVVRSVNNSRC